jgi:hypothetical protein
MKFSITQLHKLKGKFLPNKNCDRWEVINQNSDTIPIVELITIHLKISLN